VKKKCNGEGTIFKRKDGRWMAQTYVTLTDGARKRISITNPDRQKVMEKLGDVQAQERNHIPFSDEDWTVGAWLDHWLADILPGKKTRQTTIATYERVIRLHIKPYIEKVKLVKLSVRDVQGMMDKLGKAGVGVRTVHKARQALSSALGRAMREELIFRNVASERMIELPKYDPKEKYLWSIEETRQFMAVAKNHPWHFAFVLIFTYGMRRGEALGLRWSDIDFNRETFRIRQQIQQMDNQLQALPVKTRESQRDLPLTPHVKALLLEKARENGIDLSKNVPDYAFSAEHLITKSRVGTPVAPRNFNRALDMLIKRAGVRRITPHVSRHMEATFNKDIGTPLKDTQQILGHAHSDTTQKIYQHGSSDIQRQALTAIDELLHKKEGGCSQILLSHQISALKNKPVSGLAALLRSGESGEIRTLDTGLKRPIWLHMNRYLTPVMQHLRTITNTQLLGAVAVKNCCHINRGRKMRRLFKALERCATPFDTDSAKAENEQAEHPGAAL